MRDEHLIYTGLADGKVKIVPENGYKMLCTLTKAYMSEAITVQKNIKWFVSEAAV